MAETINTVVVGGGQAGIAASEHLTNCSIPHVVLERARIAERWRSARWDSIVANGPAWHDRFPNMEFPGIGPNDFPSKEMVADYFEAYAKRVRSPIRCGVEVRSVSRAEGSRNLLVETSQGDIVAENVIAATGPFQRPVIPPIVPENAGQFQIHSHAYKNPSQLPAGGVLVVGSGASGSQISLELLASGRKVFLSVGEHQRPPRSYRTRDSAWWLGVLGLWDVPPTSQSPSNITIAVSGGGGTIDFRRLAEQGIILVGTTNSYADGKLIFQSDLHKNIASGNKNYLQLLDQADAYAERFGLDLPPDPEARRMPAVSSYEIDPILELDLSASGISTIVWATGFSSDYSWLKLDVVDEMGKPKHQRGVSTEPGIFFLGLPWQSRRGSSFIWGVWHDAKYVADYIWNQQKYNNYNLWMERTEGRSINKNTLETSCQRRVYHASVLSDRSENGI